MLQLITVTFQFHAYRTLRTLTCLPYLFMMKERTTPIMGPKVTVPCLIDQPTALFRYSKKPYSSQLFTIYSTHKTRFSKRELQYFFIYSVFFSNLNTTWSQIFFPVLASKEQKDANKESFIALRQVCLFTLAVLHCTCTRQILYTATCHCRCASRGIIDS